MVSATPAATYRTNPPAGVVAYTAYQPPQVTASYGTAPTYQQTNSYQFATSMPNPVHTFSVGGKAATAYYGQPACVAPPVTYTVSDPHYQARPVYTTTSNISLSHGGPGKILTEKIKPTILKIILTNLTPDKKAHHNRNWHCI